MERDVSEKVLSDVHVFTANDIVDTYKNGVVCVSRFPFSLSSNDTVTTSVEGDKVDNDSSQDDEREDIIYDEDGDLVVHRTLPTEDKIVLTIEHVMETKLQDVGLQVWQGCLLLCDLVLHHQSKFKDAKVLDLGAGVGLTSVVSGLFAHSVTVTDVGDSVLAMAERNININKPILGDNCCFNVKELDWCHPLSSSDGNSKYSLSKEDLKLVNGCDIMLAAEVVYDPDLTEAFFATIQSIMNKPPQKTLYMSLERRMVFTVDDLDVVSPAYDHFRGKLSELESTTDSVTFTYRQIPCDFPQCTVYERHKYLELWEIVSQWPA